MLPKCLIIVGLTFAGASQAAPGLVATHEAGNRRHSSITSNVALYVSAGQAPSPFVSAGPFKTTWHGSINADLRGEFYFGAEAGGTFRLEINDKPVLEVANGVKLSEAVPLSKGANRFKATFARPPQGDAWVRLGWTEKGTNLAPIPNEVLTHASTPDLQRDADLALGRELFLEHRCIKCHLDAATGGVPELAMDAPSFEGIGARRNAGWMARWILNPRGERPSARMPKLVASRGEAEAIAAYLATLKSGGEVALPNPQRTSTDSKPLFEKLLCTSCHTAPDVAAAEPNRISLAHVRDKFPAAKLSEFLRAPEAHYAWTRMPNFGLTEKEAQILASELLAVAPTGETSLPTGENGKQLVQTRGCLNCHTAKEPNQYKAPQIKDWASGCLGTNGHTPQFAFSEQERRALRAFGENGRMSLAQHVPVEFAERQTRLLNCNGCHGQHEGFPPLNILGGKLRPEWVAAFVGGKLHYKPRTEVHPKGEPWLEARMPVFKSYAENLAVGMAAQHGFPPRTPPTETPNPDLAKAGQKLVGKEGGFSCVSCHGVGSVAAADVFESEGINLAYSAERLLPQYYRRWLRNPLSIDPQTKMPVYFEEGRSPLTDVLEGDAEKQIKAMWHYILMKDKMPAPNLGEAP